jgi:hypothetical protein
MQGVFFGSGHDAGDMDEEVERCFSADGLGGKK